MERGSSAAPAAATTTHHHHNNNSQAGSAASSPSMTATIGDGGGAGGGGGTSIVTVAACNLNQWALDFTGNLERVLESCLEAKRQGATYRVGPELELCGYGCEDHFLEVDTFAHCWESLSELFERGGTDGILCDVGMPVLHGGARYNCRVLCRDRRVLLIRPKTALADSGNYREGRYFTAYRPPPTNDRVDGGTAMHLLPRHLFESKFGQRYAPFGAHFLRCGDGTTVGVESCEELWTPRATHIDMALSGVEIVGNGSGSHHELRKLDARLDLMINATRRCGGVYLYSNQRGCDGGRCYYDGCAMIVCNGVVLAQAEQFDLRDVQVVTATVDLEDVRSYRASIPSFGVQAADAASARLSTPGGVVCDDVLLCRDVGAVPTVGMKGPRLHSPEEECLFGPACWLWDYLRRSGATGFFLPLSGGADSSSVAVIVGAMSDMVATASRADPNGEVARECRRVCRMEDEEDGTWIPATPQDLADRVLHTAFLGTSNSSAATRSRSERLASSIGSYHLSVDIDAMVAAVLTVFRITTGKTPRFASRGGSASEDLALQNIQARLRMVMSYLFAQLLPWVRGRSGFLLVLGSANVDEGLRGYMTKYDCSSADLNPIGAISKIDLRRMLVYAARRYDFPVLDEIAFAPPTAELRPNEDDDGGTGGGEHSQTDEEDMGMSYEELGFYGRLRKISRCGPVSMFRKLRVTWSHLSAQAVADKVKRFFYFYSMNRHKMCTITPAYHAEAYSPDDNRFDLRQFLYNTRWTRQFAVIDGIVQSSKEDSETNDVAAGDKRGASGGVA